MNIQRIIRKALLEQDEKLRADGLNQNVSYQFLRTVIQGCPTIARGAFTQRPIYTLENDMLKKFPELASTGVKDVAFVSAKFADSAYIVFGKQDPNTSKPALFAYRLIPREQPIYVKNGLGGDTNCEALTPLKDLGRTQLSPKNQDQLNDFIDTIGAAYVRFEEPEEENLSLYDQVAYADLQYPDGRPVFKPLPPEQGYIWIRKGITQKTTNLPKALENLLNSEKFTGNQPENITGDEWRYSFYVKDIMPYIPALNSQKNAIRPKDIIYPKPEILNPNREQCRAAIKKLDYCRTSSVGKDCQQNILSNLITVARCGDFKMAGGILGVKDEYDDVMRSGAPYGLADLKNLFGKAQAGSVQKESLEKRINSILNEQRKKFRF